MSSFRPITFLMLIASHSVILEKLNYSFKNIKIECFNFNTTAIRLEKCEIVARRGTPGLINVAIYYEGVSDLQLNMKFFYRGTSGRYQPYLVDVILDPCWKIRPSNTILLRAAAYFRILIVILEMDVR